MRFDIITIFPKSLIHILMNLFWLEHKRKKLIEIKVHNLRDYTEDKHNTVDDSPYGGGAGMVLMADQLLKP